MTEPRPGYIYRHAAADAATVRTLLAECTRGWVWDARTMNRNLADVRDALAGWPEGRAFGPTCDVRWRRHADQFDVLLLTRMPDAPAGFAPLLPAPGAAWQTSETGYLWQVAPVPGGEDRDHQYTAVQFHAPDGSIQFVALIDTDRGANPDGG